MINYEQEVTGYYPEAKCRPQYAGDLITEYVVWLKLDILGYGGNEQSAWQSAYEKLKKEGRI
jgi:hypothetical protein